MRSGDRKLLVAGVVACVGCVLSMQLLCERFASAQITAGQGISSSSPSPNGPADSSANMNSVRKPTEPPPFDPATPPAIDPSKVKLSTLPVEVPTRPDTSVTTAEPVPAEPKTTLREQKTTPVEPRTTAVEPRVAPRATAVEPRATPVEPKPAPVTGGPPVRRAPAPIDPAPPEWSAAPATRMADQPAAAGAVVGVDSLGRRASSESPAAPSAVRSSEPASVAPVPARPRPTAPGASSDDVMPPADLRR
jgi:hypothetical protein